MNKITIKQFLEYTNVYVPVYIEDEFQRYDPFEGTPKELLEFFDKNDFSKYKCIDCPIDYIRNVDGGHFEDDKKSAHGIVIGIGIENWKKYFC